MRLRLLAAVAVVGAALLAPSAAFAAPVLDTPAPGTLTTNAPIDFTWHDAAAEDLFRVVSGDIVTGSCPASPAGIVNNVSGDLFTPFTPLEFLQYVPASNVSACFYVEAQDGVTITDTNPVLITYDKPLGVSVTAPTDPSTVHGGSVTVSASVTDPGGSGVTQVNFFADGPGGQISLGTDTLGTLGTYSVGWNTTLLNGLYTVWAVGVDGANLQTTSPAIANVRVDNTPPSVSVTAPASSSTVHGAAVTLSATATDPGGSGVTGVDFFATKSGGSPVLIGSDSASSPYSVVWNTTTGSFLDGSYTITAVATDGATLTNSATTTNVTLDNSGPSGSITVPTGGALLRGTTGLTASVSDATGVASVEFEYSSDGGTNWNHISTDSIGPTWTANWDTSVLNGAFLVHAVMIDTLANPATTTGNVAVSIDNAAPTVTLGGVTTPSSVRGTLNLTGLSPNGTGSAVASVLFGYRLGSIGGFTDIGVADTTAPYGVSFNTAGLADGTYDFQALITDAAGNTGTSVVSGVQVDNHAPSVPGTPTGFSLVQGAPAITFAASTDPPFGVDHYNVLRDGNLAGVVVAPTTAFTDNASLADGGPYTYSVVAVDKAGNSSGASGGFQIFVDSASHSAPTSVTALATPTNQRPQISWVAPTNAPFLDHYDVYRDSNPTRVGFAAASSTTFADLSGTLTEGLHTYQVVAADVSDTTFGVTSGAVTILYDTTAPAAPTGVTATAALDGSIGITWLAATDGNGSGVARYVVRRSLSSTPPASVSDGDATCQGTATSCTDATALNGKLYSYAVFAVDVAGNVSLAGVTPAVTARDQLAPAAPKGLSAAPADASVALKWAAAGPEDDVAGYVLVAKQGLKGPVNETDGTRVCAAIVATSTNCIATGLANGATYTFGLFALDEALNRSLPAVVTSAPNGKVTDTKAPAAVSKLKAHVSGHKVTLTWKNPADDDFDHVEITAGQRKPAALKASKRVYSGRGTKATTTLAAGQSRWFVVVAYDAVGNASLPASVHVSIKAASKFGPAPRAKVHGKVRLSWPVAKGAKYYNVQVYAGKTRILISWPAGRVLQLPRAKLKRGTTYTWYVWPGLGAKAKAHYGKLIGKNAFTFTG